MKTGIFLMIMLMAFTAKGEDIENGWNSITRIVKIHSEGARTLFKLNDPGGTCGHPDFWSLPLDDSAKNKAKLSMLLAAFMAGKAVNLRCENSLVTDFEILD